MFYAGQMPQQPMVPQYQQRQVNGWYTVKSFNDVQNMPLPVDGSQTMFMLENEPIFYICSLMNGRKVVQGFEFKAMEQKQENRVSLNDIAAQLQQITTVLNRHESVIKDLGGADGESDLRTE